MNPFGDMFIHTQITACRCGHVDSDHAERYNWYSCNVMGCSCTGFQASTEQHDFDPVTLANECSDCGTTHDNETHGG